MRLHCLLPLVLLFPSSAAYAAGAPALDAATAASANDLQRAAWACEAGATALAPGKGGERFFLGTVDDSAARDVPPLSLADETLTGLGSLSDGNGWSNISFSCSMAAGLRQATAFAFKVLSPIPADGSETPPPDVATSPGAADMVWTTGGTELMTLVHGVPETDDSDFFASCAPGSGEVTLSLDRTVEWLSDTTYAAISVAAGGGSGLYVARGVMNDSLGAFTPEFSVPATDPLFGWLASGQSLLVNIAAELPYEVSLKASAKAVKAFSAACAG